MSLIVEKRNDSLKSIDGSDQIYYADYLSLFAVLQLQKNKTGRGKILSFYHLSITGWTYDDPLSEDIAIKNL